VFIGRPYGLTRKRSRAGPKRRLGFLLEDPADLGQGFCFSQFEDSGEAVKDGVVIEAMSALGPFGFGQQTHRGVIVDGLSGKGCAANHFADAVHFGRRFEPCFLFGSCQFHASVTVDPSCDHRSHSTGTEGTDAILIIHNPVKHPKRPMTVGTYFTLCKM
jgi:hypothetical protein